MTVQFLEKKREKIEASTKSVWILTYVYKRLLSSTGLMPVVEHSPAVEVCF